MNTSNKKTKGRPSGYNINVANKICQLLIDGLSINKIATRSDTPDKRTIYNWIMDNDDFFTQFTRAKEIQIEDYVDSLFDLSNAADPKTAHVYRLKIDTIKWVAEKLLPKKYGAKVEHQGSLDISVTVNDRYEKLPEKPPQKIDGQVDEAEVIDHKKPQDVDGDDHA